jgi:chemotaxis family two-component system response regulator Rcp1
VGQPCVRILLAEDNDGDILLIRRALDRDIGPYQPLLAKDGEEALQGLERANADESTPCLDCVVLDLNLPRLSGIQVPERVRSSPRWVAAAVIISTSSDSPRDKSRSIPAGSQPVLSETYGSGRVHESRRDG